MSFVFFRLRLSTSPPYLLHGGLEPAENSLAKPRDAPASRGTSLACETSAADCKPEHPSSTPSNEPGPPRRAVVSFRKTSSKQRNVMRSFGGSVSIAPREQPTWNLDGRSVKCSAMLVAALHSSSGPGVLKMDTLSCCFLVCFLMYSNLKHSL